jgi:predicted phage tail protein
LHDKAVAGYKVIIDSKDKSHQDYFNNEISLEIKLIPVLRGAGGGNQGWGMIVMAVIIAAVAMWNPSFLAMSSQTQTSLYLTAASMALNGVSALLYKPPNMNNNLTAAEVEQNKGFYFNGPINLSKQGSPVPLAYGKVMTGSVIIHAGVTTVEG